MNKRSVVPVALAVVFLFASLPVIAHGSPVEKCKSFAQKEVPDEKDKIWKITLVEKGKVVVEKVIRRPVK